MTRRMSQTGAVRTFARSNRSAAATGSSIPSFRPNRMASSRMRAAVQAAELLGGFDGAGPIGFRGHIVPDERRSRPELVGQRLALIVEHVADHHLRTLRYQRRASAAPWPRAPPLTSTTLLSKRAISAPPITNRE